MSKWDVFLWKFFFFFFNSKPMFSSLYIWWNHSCSILNNTIIWSIFKLLQWEINIIDHQTLYVYLLLQFFEIIETDACTSGCGAERNGTHFGGVWIEEEAVLGINKLELLKSWKNLSKIVFPNHLFFYVSVRPCTQIFLKSDAAI